MMRVKELMKLRTLAGQWVTFSKEARKRIDPEVIQFIEGANRMDRRLHQEAKLLLDAQIRQLMVRRLLACLRACWVYVYGCGGETTAWVHVLR